MRDVSYGTFVTDQVPGRGGREMFVEHAVQAPGLILVSGDAVRDLLRCVAEEVVRLTLHGPDAGV